MKKREKNFNEAGPTKSQGGQTFLSGKKRMGWENGREEGLPSCLKFRLSAIGGLSASVENKARTGCQAARGTR
jgi:hypothetical protein